MKPAILILHASGVNRDAEAARACELAGGAPEIVHINQLRCGERKLTDYPMLLLPGGFSYGDALGAGVRLALDLQVYFHDQLHDFIDRGRLVLGICNGFQALVKAGVLPGVRADRSATGLRAIEEMALRRVTLTENAGGHFECRWVHLAVNRRAKAAFLRNIEDLIFCPVAHGEGNFQVKDAEMLAEIEQEGLVAFRYVDAEGRPANGVYPLNPNGSVADIAGICNRRGNVVGLMPHPEDHILPIQNPLGGSGRLGLALFQAMVAAL
ncbi:MAG: phosphoribosylformylglycinamidine synthase I [Caldilinea sp.]|uniref:phosphoribosylformylglycinamidine synthase I n=1 Tax=Caldilinea sp. TaxID=2293560 RepID=UPI0030A1F211